MLFESFGTLSDKNLTTLTFLLKGSIDGTNNDFKRMGLDIVRSCSSYRAIIIPITLCIKTQTLKLPINPFCYQTQIFFARANQKQLLIVFRWYSRRQTLE